MYGVIRYSVLSWVLILIGLAGLTVNTIGLLDPTTVGNDHPELRDRSPRTLSEKEFWDRAGRMDGEASGPFVERLCGVVKDRFLFIDPEHCGPSFCENWLIWLYSLRRGHHEWTSTRRAVAVGGGHCSQHAIVLNNLLRAEGIASRIVHLNGHVVNEVETDGRRRVVDPTYGIVFAESLSELEDAPRRARAAYVSAGCDDNEARYLVDAFTSKHDNHAFDTARAYASRRSTIELVSLWAVWGIPPPAILAGVALKSSRFAFDSRAPHR